MTACPNCLQSATRQHWGGYSNRCAHCCARLIRSARPLRDAQDALFAALELRRPLTPSKARVLRALRLLDARTAAGKPRRLTSRVASTLKP